MMGCAQIRGTFQIVVIGQDLVGSVQWAHAM